MSDKIALLLALGLIVALGYCGYQFWRAGLDMPAVDLERLAAMDRGRRRK